MDNLDVFQLHSRWSLLTSAGMCTGPEQSLSGQRRYSRVDADTLLNYGRRFWTERPSQWTVRLLLQPSIDGTGVSTMEPSSHKP
jgi:hypothetical protein